MAAEQSYYPRSSAFVGWIAFAGSIMLILGLFHFVQGVLALTYADYFLVDESRLLGGLDYPAWGWIHLLGGILVFLAGVGVFSGRVWARAVGVALAAGSAVGTFGFLDAYPIWGLLMIAMDLMIIYALTVHGSYVRITDRPAT